MTVAATVGVSWLVVVVRGRPGGGVKDALAGAVHQQLVRARKYMPRIGQTTAARRKRN